MLTAVSMSALMASAGISSGPAAFPLLRVMMAFLISAFEGLSQLMGSSVSADGMSGGESGVGRFSSSLKCSAHRFSCSLVVVSGIPVDNQDKLLKVSSSVCKRNSRFVHPLAV